MLADLVRKHSDIIASWSVDDLSHEGLNLRIKARIEFQDGSVLYVRQVVIEGVAFKYAYQWQDRHGTLICRWDNAPHWKSLATYPHHQHIGSSTATVQESNGGDLAVILAEIAGQLRQTLQ